jgi:hypothetical protein
MHSEDQPHDAKVVIAMQVADKNVIDAKKIGLKFHQLHLCSFTTIHKKMPVLYFNQLSGRESSVSWQRTA